MFGVDIIKKTGTEEYYIIDLNNFPSFSSIKNLSDLILKLIMEKLNYKS